MKFSLKNKEFNKKRLTIFDRKQQTSPNFKSLSKQSLSKSKSPYEKHTNHNMTVSYDLVKTDIRQAHASRQNKPNLNDLELSQIQEENGQLINSNSSNVENNLIKSQHKNFSNNQSDSLILRNDKSQRKHAILPLSKPIQSVYHEQQKNMRENWLLKNPPTTTSQNINFHPSKQIVFQPISRKSKSKSYQKQKQDTKSKKIQSISSQKLVKQYNYTIKGNNLQLNQKRIKTQQKSQRLQLQQEMFFKNNLLTQEIKQLKQTIQQQHLQIKYLKNQKQIMESNQVLQYDSKQQNYKKTLHQSPSKFNKKSESKSNQQQQQMNKLREVYQILVQNQSKIKIMQTRQKNLKASVLIYIQKIQNKLIEAVSIKYVQYKKELTQRLSQFDKYIHKCCDLQDKLNLYSNTIRSVSESLRITKLKQQNIQLQIKQASMRTNYIYNQVQNDKHRRPKQSNNYQAQSMSRNIPKFPVNYQNNFCKIPDSQSDISSIKRVQYDYDEFQQKQQHKELYVLSKNLLGKNDSNHNSEQSISSFLDQKYSHLVYKKQNLMVKDNKNEFQPIGNRKDFKPNQQNAPRFCEQSSLRSEIYEIDDQSYNFYGSQVKNQNIQKLSPFQANKMFKTKSIRKNQEQYKNRSFYEFQDYQNKQFGQSGSLHYNERNPHDFNFNNDKFLRKAQDISFQSPNLALKKDLISDTLQEEQARIICLLQQKHYKFPVQCWVDQMGCLRRKNHTYLFDSQGNVIVTTQSAFKRLCQHNVCLAIS